jgi:5'-3' exonuclease
VVRKPCEEVLMARAKRNKNPNADLVKAVQDHTDQIIDFYEKIEYKRPVIVLDFQRQQLQAYTYEHYKVRLSKESQVVLDQEYEKAMDEDKILVLVWDDATQRLLTTTFVYD